MRGTSIFVGVVLAVLSNRAVGQRQQPIDAKDGGLRRSLQTTSNNLMEVTRSQYVLSTLESLIDLSGLSNALASSTTPLTIFAPTNLAFQQFPVNLTTSTESNRTLLAEILKYHVVPQQLRAEAIETGVSYTSVQGEAIRMTRKNGYVFLNYIEGSNDPFATRIMYPNVGASNGIIHYINQVLLPPSLQNKYYPGSSGTSNEQPQTVPLATPAPVTVVVPAPTTSAPVLPAPTTPAPVMPAPTTPAPVPPAPTTLAPVMPAPTTPAPVVPAPTAAPSLFPTVVADPDAMPPPVMVTIELPPSSNNNNNPAQPVFLPPQDGQPMPVAAPVSMPVAVPMPVQLPVPTRPVRQPVYIIPALPIPTTNVGALGEEETDGSNDTGSEFRSVTVGLPPRGQQTLSPRTGLPTSSPQGLPTSSPQGLPTSSPRAGLPTSSPRGGLPTSSTTTTNSVNELSKSKQAKKGDKSNNKY